MKVRFVKPVDTRDPVKSKRAFARWNRYFTLGKEYEVIVDDGTCIRVLDDEGTNMGMPRECFEEVISYKVGAEEVTPVSKKKEEKKEMKTEFKVGDKVKLVALNDAAGFMSYSGDKVGSVGEVMGERRTRLISVKFPEHPEAYGYAVSCLRLAEEKDLIREYQIGDKVVIVNFCGLGDYARYGETITINYKSSKPETQGYLYGGATKNGEHVLVWPYEIAPYVEPKRVPKPRREKKVKGPKATAKVFKVGDIITGNDKSNDRYGITNSKMTKGEVTAVNGDTISVRVLEHEIGFVGNDFEVMAKFFKKVKPEGNTRGYTAKFGIYEVTYEGDVTTAKNTKTGKTAKVVRYYTDAPDTLVATREAINKLEGVK